MAHRTFLATLLAVLALSPWGCGVDDRPRISIEFGAYPDELEAAEVVIDGTLVGKLERTGQATRISFPVEPGVHEVAIRHPRLTCVPRNVEVEHSGQKVRLLADIRETWNDGEIRPLIVLDG